MYVKVEYKLLEERSLSKEKIDSWVRRLKEAPPAVFKLKGKFIIIIRKIMIWKRRLEINRMYISSYRNQNRVTMKIIQS